MGLLCLHNLSCSEESLSQISGSSVCSEADALFERRYRETAVFLSRETTESRKIKEDGRKLPKRRHGYTDRMCGL